MQATKVCELIQWASELRIYDGTLDVVDFGMVAPVGEMRRFPARLGPPSPSTDPPATEELPMLRGSSRF